MPTKMVHRLQLPYATPEWPSISKEDESSIVRALVDLLKPIGDYRCSYVIPSKGKRRKKRKVEEKSEDVTESVQSSQPQMPPLFDHLTIGFNTTVRSLEAISKRSRPAVLKDHEADLHEPFGSSDVAAVFVCRSTLPDPITASIPLLVATASLAQPDQPPIRLVQLCTNIQTQLAEALRQPRVGFIGIRSDMPGADVLLALVRAVASPIRVSWLDSSERPRYLPVQIESTETPIGSKEKPSQTSSTSKQPQLKGRLLKAGPLAGGSRKAEGLVGESSRAGSSGTVLPKKYLRTQNRAKGEGS